MYIYLTFFPPFLCDMSNYILLVLNFIASLWLRYCKVSLTITIKVFSNALANDLQKINKARFLLSPLQYATTSMYFKNHHMTPPPPQKKMNKVRCKINKIYDSNINHN